MSIDRLKERVDQINARVATVRGRGEAATKQALVLPMLEALGFDIWNPLEVCPEFEGDFAIKKAGQREKVDLAVVFGAEPRIFMEVKAVETELDGHEGQLARYFNAVPAVSLGVLTNGAEYRFYTDSAQPNLMDTRPFFTFRTDAIDRRFDILQRFSKSQFSADALRDFATELFFTASIVTFLRSELDLRGRSPNESFVRWILGNEAVYEGRVTAAVVERFRPIVGNALQTVFRDVVRRSVAALDNGVMDAPPPESPSAVLAATPPPATAEAEAESGAAKVVTTERELAAFAEIQRMLQAAGITSRSIIDPTTKRPVPVELAYRDTTAYFGVYLNKTSWWVARLFIETRQPWVGFSLPPATLRTVLPGYEIIEGHAHAASGIRLNDVPDLQALRPAFVAAAQAVIDART